ncbi:MAG: carbon-phosphorus lyase [Candidatus Anaerobiospirillum merdipullorum]|uniref:Carbon-phosphorus lyase n=1 Tax=Candidatus Anaerobiospirillum merdipullorum TaxID=2838450 RepID=A0A9E2KQ00_9GAMM|nr:carbon-phosphorus lyase [Candidatus Anaerobiospirillum merdipullorum]
MQVKFMGTAASEGIPNPFCDCAVCTYAREHGGADVRTRASVLVDGHMLIDMSPEWSAQLKREQMTARVLDAVLFTHTHPDHFNVGEFVSRAAGFAYNIDRPLHVFGNDCAIKGAFNALDGLQGDRFVFHLLAPYLTYEFAGYSITPTLANHAKMELCYNYLIEKDGKTFFYGLDSGWLPQSTFDFLQGKHLDVVVLECTYAFREGERTTNHLNFTSLFAEIDKLKALGCLDDKSRVVTSHVSHSSTLTHAKLCALMQEHGIITAFDGMTVEI